MIECQIIFDSHTRLPNLCVSFLRRLSCLETRYWKLTPGGHGMGAGHITDYPLIFAAGVGGRTVKTLTLTW